MKQIFTLLFLAISIYSIAQNYPIVDTDVSAFFSNDTIIEKPTPDSSFYGQDAHYKGKKASYTDNQNGTITDNVTGLIWEKSMSEKMTFAEAFKYADSIKTGGYDDWRVPTIKELYSLIEFTGKVQGEKHIAFFIDTNYFEQPIGDTANGEREIDAQTWSSTQYVGQTMNGDETIFGVNFIDGRIKGYPKYNPQDKTQEKALYFRMVRGNSSYGINDFIDNKDETITDKATGLMWQKTDDGILRDWKSALAYAENLVLAGHDDWRLPNAKELQSIVNYTRSPLTTSSAAIDSMFHVSTIIDPDENGGQYPYFWTSTTHLDGINPSSSAVYIAFGEAQGKMNDSLYDVHGAGAQRSDPKSGAIENYPKFHGPQGDVQYVYNAVRCVRNTGTTSTSNKTQKIEYTIFPNPAQGFFEINSIDILKAVYLYNSIGVNMYSIFPEKRNVTIETDLLPNGAYFIKAQSDHGELAIRKVIVSN